MADVHYRRASCHYPGAERPAVAGLDLEIASGEFLVLVGPSGSGKSTALRMLAGLEPLTSGAVHIGGVDVTRREPDERSVAMVFQNYALYPQMTVAQNLGFALKLAKVGADERERRVREVARMLELEPLLERKPKALSGGQRQRVAMGRAIIRQPEVFLLDEPLSNLDARLRTHTRTELAALQERLGTTTLYVTHDQVEAMTLGHRVAVLEAGILQQCAPPSELYRRPANTFVAGFIGSPAMNLLTAPLQGDGVRLCDTSLPLPAGVLAAARRLGLDALTVGIRPESFVLTAAGPLALDVALVESLGADAYAHGRLVDSRDGQNARWIVRADGRTPPRKGERLRLSVQPEEIHAFHPLSGERLGEERTDASISSRA